ncbi:MAG: hypothetical protein HYX51_10220 [Chloroflexi bacterium]|nr:hypothetical protein [Chloroflexota bacterium]
MTSIPPPPVERPPDPSWEHYALWHNVREAFKELPLQFKSTITVSGISATEIFSFGAVLGFTIEEEVVRTLNALKVHWDPEGQYNDYLFVRQAEGFPDVLLRDVVSDGDPVIGIELKSWYLLAKEGEPSYRFKTTPAACAPQDLHVVVPWVLSNVVSGTPIVYEPYVGLNRYLAEYRNYWWQYIRNTKGKTSIRSPQDARPYPPARSNYSDDADGDSGNNFGRIGRSTILDDYVRKFEEIKLIGISVNRWRSFFVGQVASGGSKRER